MPALQLTQLLEPAEENDPALHVLQALTEVAFMMFEKAPALQLEHDEDAAKENVPKPQSRQVETLIAPIIAE